MASLTDNTMTIIEHVRGEFHYGGLLISKRENSKLSYSVSLKFHVSEGGRVESVEVMISRGELKSDYVFLYNNISELHIYPWHPETEKKDVHNIVEIKAKSQDSTFEALFAIKCTRIGIIFNNTYSGSEPGLFHTTEKAVAIINANDNEYQWDY